MIQMSQVIQIVLITGLAVCAVMDIKRKMIYAPFVVSWTVLIVFLQIIMKGISISSIAGAVAVMAAVCGISILTKGKLGMGDGLLFGMTGLGMGPAKNLYILLYCFLGAFAAAIVLLVLFHAKKETRIPLAPFILLGSILVMS